MSVRTRLIEKNYSPLLVRKYQAFGWPLFVGIICDSDLGDLDELVWNTLSSVSPESIDKDLQACRNLVGSLLDTIVKYYHEESKGSVEGVAVFYYVDKCAISSLYGDFMVHKACRDEFYSILNILPHI